MGWTFEPFDRRDPNPRFSLRGNDPSPWIGLSARAPGLTIPPAVLARAD